MNKTNNEKTKEETITNVKHSENQKKAAVPKVYVLFCGQNGEIY
jgi:hypothetical protein